MAIIEAEGLTKVIRNAVKPPGLAGSLKHLFTREYTEKTAVDHIRLHVEAGEAVAYIGPNGAGKSTTIKMLTGILVPTSGTVTVDGLIPHKQREANAREIGVVFGQRTQLWWDIPIIESFALNRDIYEITAARYKENMDRFTQLLGLDEFISQPARKLSLGQRMRADLAMSLLHDPKILYLDEPTIGLDIDVKERVRAFIRETNRNGTTVMLTTHDLGDIEDICERIVIIDYGKIIYDGTLMEVKNRYARERTLRVQVAGLAADGALPAETKAKLETGLAGFHVGVQYPSGSEVHIAFDKDGVSARELIRRIIDLADVADFAIDEPKIGTVIKQVYARTLDIKGAGADGGK
jgi:ABC-2 type transport system ATP-binding protein